MTTEWHERWQTGRIGFHSSELHSDLASYQKAFLGDGPHRVLVPLCGKTVDMVWLAEQGHEVVGVELVPQAVGEFFEEQGLSPKIEERDNCSIYRSGRVTVVCGDMLALDAETLGPITRVWDRAALVALPLPLRVPYAVHLQSIAQAGTKLLLNVFEYDPGAMSGPPFSVTESEVREHFTNCKIELLEERDALDSFPRFRDLGNTYWTVRTFLIEW